MTVPLKYPKYKVGQEMILIAQNNLDRFCEIIKIDLFEKSKYYKARFKIESIDKLGGQDQYSGHIGKEYFYFHPSWIRPVVKRIYNFL